MAKLSEGTRAGPEPMRNGEVDPPCRPLPEWLNEVRQQQGISFRALAAKTREVDPRGRGLNASHIAGLANGRETPGPLSLELLAAAIGIPTESFAEHRLARFRDQFDERRVGPQRAWRNLESLEHDLDRSARERYGLNESS